MYFNNVHFILNIIRKTYNKIGGWNYKMDILTLMKINTIRCGVVYECILPIYIFHVIYDTNSILFAAGHNNTLEGKWNFNFLNNFISWYEL